MTFNHNTAIIAEHNKSKLVTFREIFYVCSGTQRYDVIRTEMCNTTMEQAFGLLCCSHSESFEFQTTSIKLNLILIICFQPSTVFLPLPPAGETVN